MASYEYRILQSAAGAPVTHLNDRINTLAGEGWEVVELSGDATVNVLLRRAKTQASAPRAAAPQPSQEG